MIFKDRLTTYWQDFDGALFDLAVVLGIVKEDEEPYPKWLFWTNNPISVALDRMLFELCEIGAIELNDESQYRWNKDFDFKNLGKTPDVEVSKQAEIEQRPIPTVAQLLDMAHKAGYDSFGLCVDPELTNALTVQ